MNSFFRKFRVSHYTPRVLLPSFGQTGIYSKIVHRSFSTEKSLLFQCKECGKEYSKWQGQCHGCNAWNSIIQKENQVIRSQPHAKYASSSGHKVYVSKLQDISPKQQSRVVLDGIELNRVFGGGIVPGSMILIGGEPGIGKSSLLLRISSNICKKSSKGVLYVSGEESEEQVKMRCDRLGISNSNLYLLHETNLDSILNHIYQFVSFRIDSHLVFFLFDNYNRFNPNC